MPDAPTPLDLDAIRAMLGDHPALGRSAALDLIHEVEVQRILIDALREGVRILQTARPAPAWDEEAAWREAVRLYPTEHVGYDHPVPSNCQCDECYRREVQRDAYVAGRLAVVREHLPVTPDGRFYCPVHGDLLSGNRSIRCAEAPAGHEHLPTLPDRETVARAIFDTAASGAAVEFGLDGPVPWADLDDHDREFMGRQADAILSLLPGRSEAEVKAEGIREAADWLAHEYGNDGFPCPELRTRADRLAAEGGAS